MGLSLTSMGVVGLRLQSAKVGSRYGSSLVWLAYGANYYTYLPYNLYSPIFAADMNTYFIYLAIAIV